MEKKCGNTIFTLWGVSKRPLFPSLLLSSQAGRLKSVKALGWYAEEYGLAQVSLNLCDYQVTSIHTAFEECSKDARVSSIN